MFTAALDSGILVCPQTAYCFPHILLVNNEEEMLCQVPGILPEGKTPVTSMHLALIEFQTGLHKTLTG